MANDAPGQQVDGLPLSDTMVALLDFRPLRAYQRRAYVHFVIESVVRTGHQRHKIRAQHQRYAGLSKDPEG